MFLGVTSGLLAGVQYAPQIIRTYHLKLVGALSIPMMVIQSPGGIVMAVSIAMRPGTDWTSMSRVPSRSDRRSRNHFRHGWD